MAKDGSVPLWARKNAVSRVMPRKPDKVPAWRLGMVEAMRQQKPQDPVSRALQASREGRISRVLRMQSEPVELSAPVEPEPIPETVPRVSETTVQVLGLPVPIPVPFVPNSELLERIKALETENAALRASAEPTIEVTESDVIEGEQ